MDEWTPRHGPYVIPLASILVIDEANSRTRYGSVDALAESILKEGLKQPLEVWDRKGTGVVLNVGFRRHRALTLIQKGAPEPLMVSVEFAIYANEREAQIGNLASDVWEPVHPADRARRLFQLHRDGFGSITDLAKEIGLSRGEVQDLIACWKFLSPRTLDAWRNDVEGRAVPLYRLVLWSAHTHTEQDKLLDQWLVNEGIETADEQRRRPRKRQRRMRPVNEIRRKIDELEAQDKSATTAGRAMLDVLDWVLCERDNL